MTTFRIEIETVSDSNVHGSACEHVKVTLLAYESRHHVRYVDEAQAEIRGVGEFWHHRALTEAVRRLRRDRWQKRDLKRQPRCIAEYRQLGNELQAAFMSACGLNRAEQENRTWDLEIRRAKGRAAYRAKRELPAIAVLAGGIQGLK